MGEYLYRCVTCNKWSHAKKRPRDHERWVDNPTGTSYIRRRAIPGSLAPGGFVRCGPFERWEAKPAFLEVVVVNG